MAKLYFYFSAMNAGKTTTLLQSAHNYRERGMRVAILTPRLDHRDGSGVVASRIGLQAEGIAPRRTLEIGSNEAIARAVAEGAGLAVLPAVVVADPLAAGRLQALHAPGKRALSRPLFRLELAQRPRPPALDAFLALL